MTPKYAWLDDTESPGQTRRSGPGLRVEGLQVRFGGLTAVDGLSLQAPGGRVTGLIGPNGAGKSTTFNAISGALKPTDGQCWLGEERLDGWSPARRAQAGLGRTFQRIELWDSMTVHENVALGAECLLAGRHSWAQLVASPAQSRGSRDRADAALARCGIGGLAHRDVADLSTGQRRLVELARALASQFSFLLLDEPSSGLDEEESSRFASILEEVATHTGVGILLVEHDMALVRRTCKYIYVLDFGQLIYEGETTDVLTSDVVRAAYLGTEVA